ncbi:uncharacterized protein LOC131428816 [Malaya genurostris]|uniref:uncharacterized protein LOC131428816 n=1 Tax=Malaya genurostris TaxID=325434 RepID=UPI0026F3D7CA|nr:uncharacterized protein LOC131428816 [Malaya genurostris]
MDKWNIGPFNFKTLPPTQIREEWLKYKRNFQYIALANEEEDQTKLKYIFLAKAGPDVQEVFSSLPSADVIEDTEKTIKPFEVAIQHFDKYFAPRHHETFERHIFWTLKPSTDESLEKFLLRATEQARKCNFGTSKDTSIEISVIDKLILLAPSDLKEQLLQKEKLTLDELGKMVNAYSSVKYQASQMTSSIPGSNLNALDVAGKVIMQVIQNAQLKNKVCDKCGKTGHFAKRCRSSSGTKRTAHEQQATVKKRRRINAIDVSAKDTDEHTSNFIYSIGETEEIIWVKVGGVLAQMMIDSGSCKNIIDERTWRHLVVQGLTMRNVRKRSDLTFKPYGSHAEPLEVLRVFDADVTIQDADKLLKQ